MPLIGLWLTYAAAAAAAVWLARRYAGSISARAGLALTLLPLLLVGRAMLTGGLYGPSDLYFESNPWKRLPMAREMLPPRNPILSDLAFANLPWRAAVREAVVNGRAPLWNRYVLGGGPLLGAAQAGVFHPSTVLGLWLPLPMSWTFSCAFTIFLALLSAFLLFRDLGLGERAAFVGAIGWGFSTYVVFWDGWSVGPSTATFPLLVLGLRRLAHESGQGGVGLTATALCLSLFGGHPESFFHGAAAGGVCFLWELLARRSARGSAARALGGVAAAGILAALLSAPQLLPLLEAVPHSAEYRARRRALEAGPARQSVSVSESASRLLPDLLPFAHGLYGRSAVADPGDGSGMPLGYAGAVLFPLGVVAFFGTPRNRERWLFLALAAAGLAYGASAPGLLDATARLPGFALALNYRLVFLAGFGFAGLAALGTEALASPGAPRRLAVASAIAAAILAAAYLASGSVFRDRGLEASFVRREFLVEILPVVLLGAAAAAARRRPRAVADAALVYLALQRVVEMSGTYPTLPAGTLAPPLPTLAALPVGADPARIVAADGTFRPNAAALYGVEDVRGYESIVLDRFADTFPLWSSPQTASFNRVDDLGHPFLDFLNARFAVGAPDAAVPDGWLEQARGPELAILSNPRALPRAFVPRTVKAVLDPLTEMASVRDFSEVAFLRGRGNGDVGAAPNGPAELRLRASGPDLFVDVDASSPVFVATSLPDWPGWIAASDGMEFPIVTVNHAFVGFRVDAGRRTVRLHYAPRSWRWGLGAAAAGIVLAAALSVRRRRTARPRAS
jgi:hypothetical protein